MVDVKYPRNVWQRMIELLQSQRYWMNEIAADFDLTVQMLKALHEIPNPGSITMKELATEIWCDASNATGIVDRLEARGYVERRPDQSDRRVKCVGLTAAGRRLRRKIDERLTQLPPALAELSAEDQRVFGEILEQALENAHRQLAEREADPTVLKARASA